MTEKTAFTILLPTRDRAETLMWSLRTCTMQDYDRLRIIVSDNQSRDDTEEIVRSIDDPRVTYLKTPRPLGMTENWEFALSHAGDGMVSVCGDDDGYLPGALDLVHDLVSLNGLKAINQARDGYCWPNFPEPQQRNRLSIHVGNGLKILDGREAIQSARDNPNVYMRLPIIYKGFVDTEIIERCKAVSSNGEFFQSMVPDVYSGIAVAACVGTYGFSERAFALNGASGRSGGTTIFHPASDSDKQANQRSNEHAEAFVRESKPPFHDQLDFAPSIPIILAECIMQAQRNGLLAGVEVELKEVLQSATRVARMANQYTYDQVAKAVRSTADKNGLGPLADELLSQPMGRATPRKGYVRGLDVVNRRVNIDASEHDVSNIYEAALLHGRLCADGLRAYTGPWPTLQATFQNAVSELRRRVPRRARAS